MTVTTEACDLGAARQARAKTLGPLGSGRAHSAGRFEPALRELVLEGDDEDELDTTTLEREFPTVHVKRAQGHEPGDLVIDDFAWRGAFDVGRFDEALSVTLLPRIVVRGVDAPGVAIEVMSRYQRRVLRRNDATRSVELDAVLDAHARLFQPSCQLDHDHALDAWQWLLRLDPAASLVAQLAALFHDVERLDSEPHERLEHRARRLLEGPASGRETAGGPQGVERLRSTLFAVGIERAIVDRVSDLVCGTSLEERESALLDDADALSFLSLMSPGYADYFGLAQTRRKVTFTLNRLGATARSKVALVRLRPDVHRLLQPG